MQAWQPDLEEGCWGAGVDAPAVDVHSVLLALQVGDDGCSLSAVAWSKDYPDGRGLTCQDRVQLLHFMFPVTRTHMIVNIQLNTHWRERERERQVVLLVV